ncbi:MAG: hypothetical protein ACI9QL_001007 [Candidatus Omnitrophota bacterium]|jgi:hypothetical protein
MSEEETAVVGLVADLVGYLDWRKEEGQRVLNVQPEHLIGLSNWGRTEISTAQTPSRSVASAPIPKPVAAPSALDTGALRFVIAERMPECNDELPVLQTRLAVVSTADAFEGEPRELMDKILRAVGYAFVDAPQQMESVPQIVDLTPLAILSMGNPALKVFMPRGDISMMRGRWKKIHGVDMLCTFDPVYISSQSASKKAVWSDVQGLIKRMELNLPDWVKK